MIKLGICGCMIDPEGDPLGMETIEDTAAAGYDYIELSLRDIAALDSAAFAALGRRLERSGLRCEACNNFFPAEQRITGPGVDFPELTRYTRFALGRASALGAEAVVYGSSGARNYPEGFSRDLGWKQIVEATRMIGDEAERAGITVAIEYHNKHEANVLLSMEEAVRLYRESDKPRVRILEDYYHLVVQNESLDVLRLAGSALAHLHFADPVGRVYPTVPKAEYRAFYRILHEIGYTRRLSIEAFTKNFRADAEKALQVLREAESETIKLFQ
jgi:sugar phosphate isomerase/epimerase